MAKLWTIKGLHLYKRSSGTEEDHTKEFAISERSTEQAIASRRGSLEYYFDGKRCAFGQEVGAESVANELRGGACEGQEAGFGAMASSE